MAARAKDKCDLCDNEWPMDCLSMFEFSPPPGTSRKIICHVCSDRIVNSRLQDSLKKIVKREVGKFLRQSTKNRDLGGSSV